MSRCQRLLSLIFIVPVVSCDVNSVDLPTLSNEITLSSDEEQKEYIEEYVTIAANKRFSGLHRGRLGMVYDANGYTDSAIQSYRDAQLLDPDEMRWPYLLALSQAKKGNISAAVESIDFALQNDPRYIPSYLAKGFWLIDLNRNEEACGLFESIDALSSSTSNYQAFVNMGRAQCLLELGEVERSYQLVESISREFTHSYLDRLRLRIQQVRIPGFEVSGDHLSAASPRSELSWSDPIAGEVVEFTYGLANESILAQRLIDAGRFDDAIDLLVDLRSRHASNFHVLNLLSIAYESINDYERADELLMSAEVEHDGIPLFHFAMARLFERKGDPDSALKHYRRTINLDPSLFDAYEAIARLSIAQNDLGSARAALLFSMKLRPNDFGTQYLLGVIAGSEANWTESVGYFESAIRINPASAASYANLALSLFEIQRLEDATVAMAQAIQLDSESETVRRSVAVLRENGIQVSGLTESQ